MNGAPPPRLAPHRKLLRAAAEQLLPEAVLVTRGPAGQPRRVALTFDDGPDHMTSEYLDLLDRYRVRCTFFLVGSHCHEHRDLVLEIVRRGHEVANHGYTHTPLPKLSRSQLLEELGATQALLPPEARGRRMVRPPGGATSMRSLLLTAQAGYQTVLWSLDSDDCRTESPADVESRLAPTRVGGGEVVLLHEGQRWTLAALPGVIERLLEAGVTLTTVGELLHEPG